MSLGDAKIEKVKDSNGQQRNSRIPQKPLNKYIKAALLTLLKRDDIKIKDDVQAGSNVATITDLKGKYLFSYDNAWDYGWYRIFMANPKEGAKPILVAEMDWYENDGYTNPQQQDVFDIFNAINRKRVELREKQDEMLAIEKSRKDLTPEEIQALKALGIAR